MGGGAPSARVTRRISHPAGHGAGESAAELHARLLSRRAEIQEVVLTRVYAISDPAEVSDRTYTENLRTAVISAIDFALEGTRGSPRDPPPVPPALLVQARLAARNSVGLDTVLRRYFAGYALLGDFLVEEVEHGDFEGDALKLLLRALASVFDRLITTVSEEYVRESQDRRNTTRKRRADLAQRLLAAEKVDAAELAYDFEAIHIGLLAEGPGAEQAIRELASALERRLLVVCPDEDPLWAWLGGRTSFDFERLTELASKLLPGSCRLAFGEPGAGLSGWRLTHRQAKAALSVAKRRSDRITGYAEVALLASMLQDDLLVSSLRRIYLAPLEDERDGGETARETLRAYFAAGRNSASAAAALGVTRQTVNNRLRAVEQKIERPIEACAHELEAALRLEG